MHWHLLCRVIDNLGDAAVMWRIARALALEHGQSAVFFIDRIDALESLVPGARASLQQRTMLQGVALGSLHDEATMASAHRPDAVVTGLEVPLDYDRRALLRQQRSTWIGYQYLSAEEWVDGCHGLRSTKADGSVEHFFFPGFTAATGGLLREHDLDARRRAFDHAARCRFLASLDPRRCAIDDDEEACRVSLFCYPDAPVDLLVDAIARQSRLVHLLVPDALLARLVLVHPWLNQPSTLHERSLGRMRLHPIPFVPQRDYDLLLWSCTLNFVRGEDSWTRAIWSGLPFVWQAYPQADDLHLEKVDAFLSRLPAAAGPQIPAVTRGWNAPRALRHETSAARAWSDGIGQLLEAPASSEATADTRSAAPADIRHALQRFAMQLPRQLPEAMIAMPAG